MAFGYRSAEGHGTGPIDTATPVKGEHLYRVGVAAISAALWAYVALRAAELSITHDECISLWNARQLLDLQPGVLSTSNTHPTNTLWMLLAITTIGQGELALRLGSVLAFGGYLLGAARIAATLRPRVLGLAAFLLLTTNPFVLDFFSLARGYGPALAFQMLSLSCFVRWVPGRTAAGKRGALVFGGLAVLSQFTFLYYHVALIGTVALVELRDGIGGPAERVRTWFRDSRYGLALNGVFLALVAAALVSLAVRDQLYFGGREGFWTDTIGSLARATLYDRELARMDVVLASAVVLAMGLGTLVAVVRRGSEEARPAIALLYVLGGVIAEPMLAKALFGTPLPVERMALLYVPLTGVCLVSALGVGAAWRAARIAAVAAAATLAVGGTVHLLTSASPATTYSWRYDAHTKDVMRDLSQRRDAGETTRLGVTWLFLPASEYYRELWALDRVSVRAIDTAFSFDLERYEVEPRYFGKATGPHPSFESIQFELERGAFNALYVTMGVWKNALSGNVDTKWEHLFPDSGSVAVGLR